MASASWTDEETCKLIEIWGDKSIQAMLEGCKRNRDMFNKIAREMEAAGYHKTSEQCNSKIRKLKLEYRKIKDDRNKTGRGRKTWTFFDAMDSVLGHKPATQPPVLIQSGEVVEATDDTTKKGDEDEVDGEGKVGDSESGQSSLDGNEGSVTTSRPETPVVEEKKAAGGNKKRRRSNEKVNKMEYLVEKVIKMQEESDEHYLRLEEKMLRMEERRQKESREFQLKMMSLLCNSHAQGPIPRPTGSAPSTSYPYPPMYTFPPPPNSADEY